jgi:hypothetical protein
MTRTLAVQYSIFAVAGMAIDDERYATMMMLFKRVMQARFVPLYYARDLINKIQQLKHGARSVEEYYQELQIGMLHCNLEEREDAAMAQLFAGLNREI